MNLKHHPFPVLARLERVVAVSFAFPESVLRPLVPSGLAIDTYEGLGCGCCPHQQASVSKRPSL